MQQYGILRGYEGNCKQHKSRSTIRCFSITSCNCHKAFNRSQENITKPMRIHKRFPPASHCPQGTAPRHPPSPVLGSSTKLVAPRHVAPVAGQAPQPPERGTEPPVPLGLGTYRAHQQEVGKAMWITSGRYTLGFQARACTLLSI